MKIKSLVSALPKASNTGWGTAGRRINEELKNLAFVTDLNEVNGGVFLERDLPVQFNVPVLDSVRGVDLLPSHPQMYSNHCVGYSFCEENLLMGRYALNVPGNWEALVVGSTWAKQQMEAQLSSECYPNHGIHVAFQGVDADVFKPDPKIIRGEVFTIFSGGKWEYRKAQDVVIRAVAVLMERHKNVRLITSWWNPWPVSADTMRHSTLIKNTRDTSATALINGVKEITMLSECSHAELARYMNECHVALFPNRCEAGTNLVMMEAMSCGLPVIATAMHGHYDVTHSLPHWAKIPCKPFTVKRDNGVESMDVATWYEPDLDFTIAALEHAYSDWESGGSVLDAMSSENRQEMAKFTWKLCAESILEVC